MPNDHSELSLERPQDGLESEYEPFLSLDQVGRTLAPQRLPSRPWGFVEQDRIHSSLVKALAQIADGRKADIKGCLDLVIAPAL